MLPFSNGEINSTAIAAEKLENACPKGRLNHLMIIISRSVKTGDEAEKTGTTQLAFLYNMLHSLWKVQIIVQLGIHFQINSHKQYTSKAFSLLLPRTTTRRM